MAVKAYCWENTICPNADYMENMPENSAGYFTKYPKLRHMPKMSDHMESMQSSVAQITSYAENIGPYGKYLSSRRLGEG